MQQTHTLPAPNLKANSDKPVFKLFVACDDQLALSQAKKVERHIRALCGTGMTIARTSWSFSLLRHDALRKFAMTEASKADMIVVSLGRGNELPSSVQQLLESLPVRLIAGQAALTVLVAPQAEKGSTSVVPYLQRLAKGLGLDFFCNERATKPRVTPFQMPRPRSITPEEILSYHLPRNSGGARD